jgi:cytosine deaminase
MSGISTLDLEGLIHKGLRTALEQAHKSYSEGGIPIGGALVDSSSHKIIGLGCNQRIQKASPILHAETSALDNAGRLQADVYRNSTLVCRTGFYYGYIT